MISAGLRTGIIVVGIIGLAGCQSVNPSSHPKMPPLSREELQQYADQQCNTPPAGMSLTHCRYFTQMKYGIQHNFYHDDHYYGRECMLTVSWGLHNRYNVLSTRGDERLCKKAWGVISSAENLPPPPKDLPANIALDFKPAP